MPKNQLSEADSRVQIVSKRQLLHNTEYQRALHAIGWQQIEAADFFGIDKRTSRRYVDGSATVPKPLLYALRLAVHTRLSKADVGDPGSPVDVLLRLIFRLGLSERQFFRRVSTPVPEADGPLYQLEDAND
jgi:hypothetical protein